MNEIRERNAKQYLGKLRDLVYEYMPAGKALRACNYIDRVILEIKRDKRQWREKDTPSR